MSTRDIARWRRSCRFTATVAGVSAVISMSFACGVMYAERGSRPATPAS